MNPRYWAALFLLLCVSLSGCELRLFETVAEREARMKDGIILDRRSAQTVLFDSGAVDDLAVEIIEDYDVLEGDSGEDFVGVKTYCDEEEKSSDWCRDGFIKYRHNKELGCFESYCKEPPRTLQGASGSVEEVSGGVQLAQPDVKLDLTFEDLEDVDLGLLTIGQIEEFGRVRVDTSVGSMVFKLYPTLRPATVRNFVKLADTGYLQGIPFYRVIPDFIAQFGEGFDSVVDEDIDFGFGDTRVDHLSNRFGTIAFAGLDLTTFYINLGLNHDLDGQFIPFAELVSGDDVLNDLASVKTAVNDEPVEEVLMLGIEIGEVYKEYLKREIQE